MALKPTVCQTRITMAIAEANAEPPPLDLITVTHRQRRRKNEGESTDRVEDGKRCFAQHDDREELQSNVPMAHP